MMRTLQMIVQSVIAQSSLKLNKTNTCRLILIKGLTTEAQEGVNKQKNSQNKRGSSHPYKNVHPWKSVDKFAEDLVANIIYNQDGVVALNKPYGISKSEQEIVHRHNDPEWNSAVGIPNSVGYTLSDAISAVSKTLGYKSLLIVNAPERNISGVTILAEDEKKAKLVKKCLHRARCDNEIPNTYWIITTKLPICDKGEVEVAMTKKESPCKTYKQPIILDSWKNNQVKRGEVKLLKVSYQTISKSIGDLSALIEMKVSTSKWHAIRVFSSTVLFSPILGDRIHGSRVKKVMGTYMNISPFVDAAREITRLEAGLLEKLKLNPSQRVIIPTHIHLREVFLPSFLGREQDLRLVAPLPTSFQWTYDQLQFQVPTKNDEILPRLSVAASQ